MDNVTHTLFGLCLARAGGQRLGPWATPTLVVASNLPDLDVVVTLWAGQPGYLCHHRGITHALVGIAAQALALGFAMAWLGRRSGRAGPRPRPWALVAAAALGLLGHLALDGFNTYGVRPFLPFDATWYYGDAAFIVDPWMWLVLGLGALLGGPARPRPGGGRPEDEPEVEAALAHAEVLADRGDAERATEAATQALVAAAGRPPEVVRDLATLAHHLASVGWAALWWLGVGGAIASSRVPDLVALPWGLLFGAGLWLRQRGAGDRRWAPRAALAALALYVGALAALDRAAAGAAVAHAASDGFGPIDAVVAQPGPAVPWRFEVQVATPTAVRRVDVDLLAGRVGWAGVPLLRGLDDPALAAVQDTPEHAAWRAFARLPFAGRHLERDDALILGDARYLPIALPGWCNLEVPLGPEPPR